MASDPQTTETRPYLVEYPHDGVRWGATIHAASHEDAERRLLAIGAWGHVKGEVACTVCVPQGMGWLGRLLADMRVWWLNRRRA